MDQYIYTNIHVESVSKYCGVFNVTASYFIRNRAPPGNTHIPAPLVPALRHVMWNNDGLYAKLAEYTDIETLVVIAGYNMVSPKPFLNHYMLTWFGSLYDDIAVAPIFGYMTRECTVESAAIIMSVGTYTMGILSITSESRGHCGETQSESAARDYFEYGVVYDSPVYFYAVKKCIMSCFDTVTFRKFLANRKLKNSVLEKIMAEIPMCDVIVVRSYIGNVIADVTWRGPEMVKKIVNWVLNVNN